MLTFTSAAFVLKIAGCGQQVSETPYLPSIMCGALISCVLRLWSVDVHCGALLHNSLHSHAHTHALCS